jgi:Glycosyltransferases involved in cell wall biogenesis
MKNEVVEVLEKVKENARSMEENILQTKADNIVANVTVMTTVINTLKKIVPSILYEQYSEFFEVLSGFCRQCENTDFLEKNREQLHSSFELFGECIEELQSEFLKRVKTCPCCGRMVIYKPLADYYKKMTEKYQVVKKGRSETLNDDEYSCSYCQASDRDRMIISFLKKAGLQDAQEGTRLLQIAPAGIISSWIKAYCPHIYYETTDLYMDQVSFHSDIMDMHMVSDETYDVIICSHVLEHVRDDEKALSELKRILKPDGKIVFLVPIDLNASGIDEEWGLSEAENWRRFGQGDRCRTYDKSGLMHRLEKQFHVHSLGKDYFGEDIFEQCALTDTSTLYILTKSGHVPLSLAEKIEIDKELCENGPLVSIVFPCYNHEQYVAEAIESVINQSYKNIEIIAGDDGSTDGTPDIMKRYSSHFAKEFYPEENTDFRLWEYMNGMVSGKYVAVAHSDDVWEKDKLALQVAYMESHPECGACFTWCRYKDVEGRELNDLIFIQPNRNSHEWMRFFWEFGNALCHPSVLIRRKFHDKRKRYAGRQLPDFFKWIDMVQMTSIYVVPKVLVHMSRHKESTSFPSSENVTRSAVEANCGWFKTICNMDESFFKAAFAPYMRNPKADTREAIKCEKFFLMLSSSSSLMRYNALCYFYEIFDDAKECLEDEYNYTIRDLAQDELRANGVQ